MNLNLLPNSSHQSKDMPCIIWNTSMSVMMKLPWRYRVQYTNDYFLWLWSRCVKEFDPFNRSDLNAQSGAGSCNSCKSWRRTTTSSSCTAMKNFSLIPERMLTTWWVTTAISAGQITAGYALWMLILRTLIQEYVFEGEDGHTEIMPVSDFTWCCLMCNLFIAGFVFLVLIIFFIAFWLVFLQHRYGLLPLPHRTTTTFTLTLWWCWCTTPHPFQSPNCLLSTSAKSTSDWKWILRVKQDVSLI